MFRTGAGTTIANATIEGTGSDAAGSSMTVGFEVDRIDEETREGWSIVLTGRVQRVTDTALTDKVDGDGPEPWAGGDRPIMLRLVPTDCTGRRVAVLPHGGPP